MNLRSCNTRRILLCVSMLIVPISSRKSVPRSATSNSPFFDATALVKAPLTCPNSVDSSRSGGIKEVDEGIWLVSFMHYDLGYFDLEQKTLQPLDNPFGTRLSPCLRYDLLPMSPGRTYGIVAGRARPG